MSSAITRRSRSDSGTSPATIRCASPSTIAVLPTPGSPIRTGLFLVRRESTWITRRISSSRPMTGSSLPRSASSVRSRPNFSSAWTVSSGLGEVTRCGPWTSRTASASASWSGSRSATAESRPARASSRCSVEMYSSPRPALSLSAALQDLDEGGGGAGLGLGVAAQRRQGGERVAHPLAQGRGSRRRASAAPGRPGSRPARAGRAGGGRGRPRGCGARAASRCAAATASWRLDRESVCLHGRASLSALAPKSRNLSL